MIHILGYGFYWGTHGWQAGDLMVYGFYGKNTVDQSVLSEKTKNKIRCKLRIYIGNNVYLYLYILIL